MDGSRDGRQPWGQCLQGLQWDGGGGTSGSGRSLSPSQGSRMEKQNIYTMQGIQGGRAWESWQSYLKSDKGGKHRTQLPMATSLLRL